LLEAYNIFTFATMKKNQKQTNYTSVKNENNSSYSRMLKRFIEISVRFNFDKIQFLRSQNEKLQIIYANIRV
jgi:hypothetical protein